jgi:hypothetical protein
MWAGCSWRALSGTFLRHSVPTPELSNPFRGAEFLALSVVGPIAGNTEFAIIAGKSSSEFPVPMVELPGERRILS